MLYQRRRTQHPNSKVEEPKLRREKRIMAKDSVLARVASGAAVGGAIGGAVGAVYGTYDAIRYKVPGFLKIRHIGQTTLGSAAVFSLFLAAGTLIRSH
ncbi:hypothetical protein RIF29_38162 [Crotalaria pallida]|uniref:Reactive oxygen species modulator 1 n=1 Tax=Crotalaria pallida TaxID=3830 RepID=A0AAN9DZ42_CROPI